MTNPVAQLVALAYGSPEGRQRVIEAARRAGAERLARDLEVGVGCRTAPPGRAVGEAAASSSTASHEPRPAAA